MFDFQYPTDEIIKIIANYLEFASIENDKISNNIITRFNAKNIPSINIFGYLTRILKYAPCGTECFLAIIIYLERISLNKSILANIVLKSPNEDNHVFQKEIQITSYNIHRLIIAAALVSIKFLSDVFYTNMHISS